MNNDWQFWLLKKNGTTKYVFLLWQRSWSLMEKFIKICDFLDLNVTKYLTRLLDKSFFCICIFTDFVLYFISPFKNCDKWILHFHCYFFTSTRQYNVNFRIIHHHFNVITAHYDSTLFKSEKSFDEKVAHKNC